MHCEKYLRLYKEPLPMHHRGTVRERPGFAGGSRRLCTGE
jgi:hypothetical protein